MIKNFKIFEKYKNYDEDLIYNLKQRKTDKEKIDLVKYAYKHNKDIDINDDSIESVTLRKILDEKLIDISWNNYELISFFIVTNFNYIVFTRIITYIIKNCDIDPNIEPLQYLITMNIINEDTTLFDLIFNLPNFDPSFKDDMLLISIINQNDRLDILKKLVEDDRVDVDNVKLYYITDLIDDGDDNIDILEILLPHITVSNNSISDIIDLTEAISKTDINIFKIIIDNIVFDLTYNDNMLLKQCLSHNNIDNVKYLIGKIGNTNFDTDLLSKLSQKQLLPIYKGRKINRSIDD